MQGTAVKKSLSEKHLRWLGQFLSRFFYPSLQNQPCIVIGLHMGNQGVYGAHLLNNKNVSPLIFVIETMGQIVSESTYESPSIPGRQAVTKT